MGRSRGRRNCKPTLLYGGIQKVNQIGYFIVIHPVYILPFHLSDCLLAGTKLPFDFVLLVLEKANLFFAGLPPTRQMAVVRFVAPRCLWGQVLAQRLSREEATANSKPKKRQAADRNIYRHSMFE